MVEEASLEFRLRKIDERRLTRLFPFILIFCKGKLDHKFL